MLVVEEGDAELRLGLRDGGWVRLLLGGQLSLASYGKMALPLGVLSFLKLAILPIK